MDRILPRFFHGQFLSLFFAGKGFLVRLMVQEWWAENVARNSRSEVNFSPAYSMLGEDHIMVVC
jgi:hypothetical protein